MAQDSTTGALVDRFLTFNSWSTSRKTAMLGQLVASATFFTLVIGHVLLSPLGWVNMRWYDGVLAAWILECLLVAVTAGRVAAHGHDAGGPSTFTRCFSRAAPFSSSARSESPPPRSWSSPPFRS
jgi:hypothetical protein